MCEEAKLCFGPFELNLDTWELRRRGARLRVQQQPLRILALLLRHPGELITREELRMYLWPNGVHLDYEHGVNRSVNKLRHALCDSPEKPRYIETLPARGYRFIGRVEPDARIADAKDSSAVSIVKRAEDRPVHDSRGIYSAIRSRGASSKLSHPAQFPVPCRGALPLDSPFYIERDVDAKVHIAIQANDSVVLVKGARQTGKTSLLARVLERLRSHDQKALTTDMQKLTVEKYAEIDIFLRALARQIAESLELNINVEKGWESRRSASNNFERFLRRALSTQGKRIVWCIDEADRLFPRPYSTEFFSLLRAWHNERALDPDSALLRLTVVIAYATEAHLFIADSNQSPFNVGTKFELQDFTHEQTIDLNARYGYPTDEPGASELEALLGGHPHLIQRAFYELVTRQCSPTELGRIAADEDGPFAEHLRHLLLTLGRCPDLLQSVRSMLDGSVTMSTDHFYRLRAFGILAGDRARNAVPRCKLYREFLCRHLM